MESEYDVLKLQILLNLLKSAPASFDIYDFTTSPPLCVAECNHATFSPFPSIQTAGHSAWFVTMIHCIYLY